MHSFIHKLSLFKLLFPASSCITSFINNTSSDSFNCITFFFHFKCLFLVIHVWINYNGISIRRKVVPSTHVRWHSSKSCCNVEKVFFYEYWKVSIVNCSRNERHWRLWREVEVGLRSKVFVLELWTFFLYFNYDGVNCNTKGLILMIGISS